MIKNWQSKVIPDEFTQGSPGRVLEAHYFYYETNTIPRNDLEIVCGGFEKCSPQYNIDRKGYPYYFIKYTVKGKGTLKLDSQTFSLSPGTISGISPSVAHQYTSDSTDPMEHIFLTFAGKTASRLLEDHGLGEKFVIQTKKPNMILGLLKTILDVELENSLYAREICSEYIRVILFSLAGELSSGTGGLHVSQQTFLACKQYIDKNFLNLSSSSEVARACNINSKYMARLFKKHSRSSAQQYLRNLKMNKAASLLLSTQMNIYQIAGIVGYEDPYHFSRNFKKTLGLAPRAYRKKFLEP